MDDDLSDFMAEVKEIFEENKRSFCFWSSLAMLAFLWVLYFLTEEFVWYGWPFG